MAGNAALYGACPPPFLQLSNFDDKSTGYVAGRFCAPVPSINGTVECCLPCPITDWVYSNEFNIIPKAASWLNVAGMVCSLSLLISFLVLPVQRTNRHYLTVGLVAAVCLLQLGFIIPLGSQPDQCHDPITPNDMYSDLTCAFSGALLLFGGFSGIVWGFLRSLSIHLQICWQVVPGRKFFWCSLVAGWGIPAIVLAVALSVTGTSYRFGDTCHINHDKALQDYWGPLLAFAAISTILQFTTFGYCIRVYVRALINDSTVNSQSQVSSGGLPSYASRSGSIKTLTPSQAYRRIKKVIALQWRGTVIVLIIIVNVVFLAVVFVKTDNTVHAAMQDFSRAQPWLLCLVLNEGNKNACLSQVRQADLVTNEATVIAVLLVLSLNGFWTLLFLGRTSMLLGWLDIFRRPFRAAQPEFVSVDARRFSAISGTPSSNKHYEMISSPSMRPPSMPVSLSSIPMTKSAEVGNFTTTTFSLASPPPSLGLSPLPQSPRSASSVYRDSDYFGLGSSVTKTNSILINRDASSSLRSSTITSNTVTNPTSNSKSAAKDLEASYRSPKLSFSTPRPPSAGRPFSSSTSRESSLSRPYSHRHDSLPYTQPPTRSFSPHLGSIPAANDRESEIFTDEDLSGGILEEHRQRAVSPPSHTQTPIRRSESRGRSGRPSSKNDSIDGRPQAMGWDPTKTYASPTAGATIRADGLGRVLGKDADF